MTEGATKIYKSKRGRGDGEKERDKEYGKRGDKLEGERDKLEVRWTYTQKRKPEKKG